MLLAAAPTLPRPHSLHPSHDALHQSQCGPHPAPMGHAHKHACVFNGENLQAIRQIALYTPQFPQFHMMSSMHNITTQYVYHHPIIPVQWAPPPVPLEQHAQ